MYGGAGNDVFVFTAVTDTGAVATSTDVLFDFVDGSDKIDLSQIDASSLLVGDDAFTFLGTDAITTNQRGEVNYKQFDVKGSVNDYTLIYIDTDSDTAAEGIIKLMGLHRLTAGDFIL